MAETSPMEMYERAVGSMPSVSDEYWLAEQLAKCRAGDETALRQISERCLAMVLEIAKNAGGGTLADDQLLDAVQEGNAALINAIGEFRGSTTVEFVSQIANVVQARVASFIHGL